ncbi:MAG: hypothetical protein R3B40_09190 [Polyangiales bacterium]|nr:hypothetical protein [Myxococcales bacterium]MCB9656219.1 hypothetical protein [Sandaracinaceae bacterium]
MTIPPELEALSPIGGTDAGRYFLLEPDVIVALPRPGYIQSGEGATRSLVEFDRITREAGRRAAIVVLVDRVMSQDPASRRVWSQQRPDETRCAQALVCGNVLSRAIGSFFLGLSRGPVPTRMFATLHEARVWARQMVETQGGPIA